MKFLNGNGAQIPALGLGTFGLGGEACSRIVQTALQGKYIHIDTAPLYDNETEIGAGIAASGVSRDQIFVTTKVWPTEVREGDFQRSVEASLKRLNLDYVDLLLIHWPPKEGSESQWARLLNDVADRGWTKNIGVSNFTVQQLDNIVEASKRPIAANQVENHPFLDQAKLRSACQKHGVAIISYCPLGRAEDLFLEPLILDLAEQKSKTPAQIVLRWHIDTGAGAIPKTATPKRLSENIDVFDFALSKEEVGLISALARAGSRICDFEFSPRWDA